MREKKKKYFIPSLIIILCMLMAIPAFAATIQDVVINPERRGVLYIDYKDNIEGTDPVLNAEFKAYKIALINESGGYDTIIDDVGQITDDTDPDAILKTVKKFYKTSGIKPYKTATNDKGHASFQNMELGLYLVTESKPAKDHFASKSFIVSVPHMENGLWSYELTVEPKSIPAGYLEVSKTIQSNRNDKKIDFTFTINLDKYNEPVHYIKSDKTEGTLKNGESITLKHKEKAVFDMIPVGTAYTVTEQSADANGYLMTSAGASGNIKRTEISKAAFTNTQTPPATGDNYIAIIAAGIAGLALLISIILLRSLKKVRTFSN